MGSGEQYMSDPSQQCPSAWREYNTSGVRACGRPVNSQGNCHSTPVAHRKWCVTHNIMSSKGKRTKNEMCVLCCKPIVEGKEVALMCEGEICANKWIHRYCAGVPTDHYKLLEESPEPFHCYFCAQRKQAAIIEEMKNTISCLTAEIAELRVALKAKTTSRSRSNDQAMPSTRVDVSQGEDRPWS